MLFAKFCMISYDECITPSHRKWWRLCELGQNTMNCSRFYEKRQLIWNESLNHLGNCIGEVMFSMTGNVMAIPCVLYSHA
jgi:hypothetical protein